MCEAEMEIDPRRSASFQNWVGKNEAGRRTGGAALFNNQTAITKRQWQLFQSESRKQGRTADKAEMEDVNIRLFRQIDKVAGR